MLVASSEAIVTSIAKSGETATFRKRLHGFAEKVVQNRNAVDYGRRRRLLKNFVAIDPDYWEANCAVLRYRGSRIEEQRRNFAATWLWGELTQGHYQLAPWFREHDTILMRERYKGFLRRILYQRDDLHGALLRYPRARWGDAIYRPCGSG